MIKAFKYRLYPTEEQSVLMDKHFGCSRFVYNWALEKKIKAYEVDKTKLSCFELTENLPELKTQYPWLSEVTAQCLQMSIRNLDNAFTGFFRKKSRFPKFKSKHKSKLSCQFPQSIKVNFDANEISFPKIGRVKAVLHREFSGEIKTCTLSKTSTQKYFISILVEDKSTLPSKLEITEDTTLGIDVGLTHFATFSDGSKVDNPKFLSKSEKLLSKLQRRLSRKQKGSNHRQNAKLLVAKYHEKITNQRTDFLHKLTYKLVCESQTTMFVCEDLNVEGMIQNHHLAKAISDVSWNRFNSFLAYKCDWYGKTYMQIGRFDASSKICSVCGSVNQSLTLKDRTWICPSCNTNHDRDINAAINIKKFGYIRSCGTTSESKQSFSERLGSLT